MKRKTWGLKSTAALLAAGLFLSYGNGLPSAENAASAAESGDFVTFNIDKSINGGIAVKGVDISSVIACEQSGVVYKDENGQPQDIFKTLAENDVNYIRVRVWNHPYDTEGNSYGGGNCNTYNAGLIGKRAKEYGMKLLVDLQYSDFWADPDKQTEPKDWTGYSFEWKRDAVYNYTVSALTEIRDAGADIGMVQIGNETNCFFCGTKDMDEIAELFKCGIAGAHDVDRNILTAVHFANPSLTSYYEWYAQKLSEHSVDYDIFATSYYSYWHGDTNNLTSILKSISDKYNKYVMVAETAYPYTSEDGDSFGNAVSSASDSNIMRYDISPEGQEKAVLDAFRAVASVGPKGIGVFYWEPAWIGVSGNSYYENYELWQKYGSGWATETAAEYEADVTQAGGSSYDNQALFDFDGKPLPSLSVFKKVLPESNNYIPHDEPEEQYIPGDFNNDKKVNCFDLIILRQMLTDGQLGSDKRKHADFNSSGEIDAFDLEMHNSFILGDVSDLSGKQRVYNHPDNMNDQKER